VSVLDPSYKSAENHDVALAQPGEFSPLVIGTWQFWPPVALAPMAGVTSHPYRAVCQRLGAAFCLSEMVTARALVDGNAKSWKLAEFGPDERPRCLQLYGADARYVGEAVRRLADAGQVDLVDLNFGCPVRKVTSKGAGSAIPARPHLLASIIRAAVSAAGEVPVTVKLRLGIDDRHSTFLAASHVAESEGCRAVCLHARTAAQLYDGQARWEAIGELKQAVGIAVVGNGDIWEAHDALRMMRATACDGVMVGRGCLGRPWIFHDLARVFAGVEPENPPNLGGVIELMLEHARGLVGWVGEEAAIRAFRRHACWYTKGFRGSAEWRDALMATTTLGELVAVLGRLDGHQPFPPAAMRARRGKRSGTQEVSLPDRYLDDAAGCSDEDVPRQ
jgi:nifR3 family TIM-barrel protein